MADRPTRTDPPAPYLEFVSRFPKLGQAWDQMRDAEADAGPLDERTRRLLKLAVAAAREAEGATHSAVRKARRAGVSREEMEQVAALVASTMGLPNAVKVFRWIVEAWE